MQTRTNLKVCLAFRLEEIFSALDKAGVEQLEGQSRQDVEAFLLQCKFSKKSQQYFLNSESNDTVIRRGPGCNITQPRCFIVSQSNVDADALNRIRNGKKIT